jgi:NTE family protein
LAAPYLGFVYPTFSKQKNETLTLRLKVNKSNAFRVDFGGMYSSRAINTGYLSLAYRRLGSVGQTLSANSYFGKFYGSGKAQYELNFPGRLPFSFSAYFTLNRWDYFRSFATFFEDVQPSYLIQNESYGGVQVKLPLGSHSKLTANARYFYLDDQYYQTTSFTKEDTADYTTFYGESFSLEYSRNTLNRKQFASVRGRRALDGGDKHRRCIDNGGHDIYDRIHSVGDAGHQVHNVGPMGEAENDSIPFSIVPASLECGDSEVQADHI